MAFKDYNPLVLEKTKNHYAIRYLIRFTDGVQNIDKIVDFDHTSTMENFQTKCQGIIDRLDGVVDADMTANIKPNDTIIPSPKIPKTPFEIWKRKLKTLDMARFHLSLMGIDTDTDTNFQTEQTKLRNQYLANPSWWGKLYPPALVK